MRFTVWELRRLIPGSRYRWRRRVARTYTGAEAKAITQAWTAKYPHLRYEWTEDKAL